MRMIWTGTVLCAVLCLAAAPCGAAEEQFAFYGLQFGMARAEVAKLFPLQGDVLKNPGHGLADIELVFDREDQLLEIRAGWQRPDDPLQYQGLLRALRERFQVPIQARFPAVAVTLDEYSNRAAVRLLFLATGLREKNIEHFKNVFLKSMQ